MLCEDARRRSCVDVTFQQIEIPLNRPRNIIADGRDFIIDAPWITIFPGLCISITVLSLNLMGDGLRDVLDPRQTLA